MDAADLVWLMVAALERPVQVELERALLLLLFPAPSAAERRVAELGALAAMLNELADPPGATDDQQEAWAPMLRAAEYDAARPLGAPSSEALRNRYGSWGAARRAAWGLLPDGRYLGIGRPWAVAPRQHELVYRPEDIPCALRRCAFALGRRPSSWNYLRYKRAVFSRTRLSDRQALRLPDYKFILRHYETFGHALAAAAIADHELLESRARWARVEHDRRLGFAEAVDTLDERALIRIGLTPAEVMLLSRDGAGELSLSLASELARELGADLEWLAGEAAGRARPPTSPARLAGKAVEDRLKQRGILQRDAAAKLGWSTVGLRRVLSGRAEPTLAEAIALARMCELTLERLLLPDQETRAA